MEEKILAEFDGISVCDRDVDKEKRDKPLSRFEFLSRSGIFGATQGIFVRTATFI
jgi:hypothetical protein